MEVVPGIHRIEAPLGNRLVALYLLVGDEHALLIDSGLASTPEQVLQPYLDQIGLEPQKIRYVINTHADFDHTGGNAPLRRLAPNALFMCHELDRVQVEDIERMIEDRYGEFAADHGIADSEETKAWIRENADHTPIDLTLSGGERINLGGGWWLDVLHTPGHSRGHLTVYDRRSRTAIIADTALWNGLLTVDGQPAFPPTYRYVDTYLASIHRLQGMPVDTLLTSHYPVYQGEGVADFLGESRAYVERVDAALCETLQNAAEALTMREIISALATRLGQWPEGAEIFLVYPLQGHLERLHQHGRIKPGRRDDNLTWQWAA